MLSFIPLISLIANVLMTSLGAAGVVTPSVGKMVTDLAAGVLGLLGSLVPGQTKSEDVIAVLGSAMAMLMTLKADTTLPAAKLQLVDNLIGEIQAALVAYTIAGKQFDPANYAQIATV